jgi:hypothetical protein
VRCVLLLVLVSSAAYAGGPTQSDPAFLGIGMIQPPNLGGCFIDTITPGGPAADAGIARNDEIARVDGVNVFGPHACDDVTRAIVSHQPGDVIEIDLKRGDATLLVRPILATRSQVLERRVGQHVEATNLEDVDGRHWDLADRRGHALVVGTFDANCAGCSTLVDRMAERLVRRTPATSVLAVTADPDPMAPMTPARARSLRGTVPLAIADSSTFEALATTDRDRVFFLVIDCHGVVRLVAPIAPDADDIDAATDEVLAGAEQAEHARTRR